MRRAAPLLVLVLALLAIPVVVMSSAFNVSPTTGTTMVDVTAIGLDGQAVDSVGAHSSELVITIEDSAGWRIHGGVYASGYAAHATVLVALGIVIAAAVTVLRGGQAGRTVAIGLAALAVGAIVTAIVGPRWNEWAVGSMIEQSGLARDAAQAREQDADFFVVPNHTATFVAFWLVGAAAAMLAAFVGWLSRTCSRGRARS